MTSRAEVASWTRRALGEIVDLNPRSWTHEPEDADLVSFVPMRAVEEESGRLDSGQTRTWGEVKKGYTRFQDGDVLFAKITPCMENGKCAVARGLHGGRGAGSTEFHVLRSKGQVQPEYVRYFLTQREVRSAARMCMKGAAGQLRVPPNFLESLPIPVPAIEEQDRTVAELDKQFTRLDNAVAALKRVQANLKRYRASLLKAACEGRLVPTEADLARREGRTYETGEQLLQRILKERRARWEADQLAKMLAAGKSPKNDDWRTRYPEPSLPEKASLPSLPSGWTWATADQLTVLVTSGSRGWAEHYADTGPSFIRAQDIRTDRLVMANVAHVDIPTNAEGLRTRVTTDDILVTITGANVTKTACVVDDIGEAYVSQHVGLMRPVEPVLGAYLYSWIVAPQHGRRYLTDKAYGAGKPGLNLTNLREMPVAIPPLQEQARIVKAIGQHVTAESGVKAAVDREGARAAGLRRAILRSAFEGRLSEPSASPDLRCR